jgi:hypothetical protein
LPEASLDTVMSCKLSLDGSDKSTIVQPWYSGGSRKFLRGSGDERTIIRGRAP